MRLIPLGLCVAIAALVAAGQQPANLIPNPSFEDGEGDRPASWGTHVYAGKGTPTWEPTGRTGKRAVAIASQQGGDVAWEIRVPVHPDSVYRLSGWIRTENVTATTGRGALFNIHTVGGAETPALTGTKDWTEVAVEFETGRRTEVLANCLFGGWGQATGKAWFDDVRLELVHKGDREHPSALVDLSEELGPISPYIYGQFIEHLGRCIYGGIWAEMLEDRKFLNLVASRHSPWKRTGGEVGWSLTMDVERPYVGDWSVKIAVTDRAKAGGTYGIEQRGLGVVAGKEYAGHVVLAGKGTVGVSLADGARMVPVATIKVDSDDFQPHPIRFKAAFSTGDARLSIFLNRTGEVWIGTASLMPADNVKGMRADTLALLKELDAPIYRWPGGNFVSGYDWRDGIGPGDRRPPRKNPAWKGIEHNDVGLHEFLDLCREIGAEAFIAVNTGLGGAEAAAEEMEYVNGAADTPMGRLRARNGHPKPWGVKWWAIGNEMYGDWQLGHMPLEEYVKKHNRVVDAMRKVDPTFNPIAVGAKGRWSEQMLTTCSDHMSLISEHLYWQDRDDVVSHVAQIAARIREVGEAVSYTHLTLPTN